jgi:hypothetical protein
MSQSSPVIRVVAAAGYVVAAAAVRDETPEKMAKRAQLKGLVIRSFIGLRTSYDGSSHKAEIDSVTFTVRDTGKRAGAEIAEVYAGLPAAAKEPPKRLVA